MFGLNKVPVTAKPQSVRDSGAYYNLLEPAFRERMMGYAEAYASLKEKDMYYDSIPQKW